MSELLDCDLEVCYEDDEMEEDYFDNDNPEDMELLRKFQEFAGPMDCPEDEQEDGEIRGAPPEIGSQSGPPPVAESPAPTSSGTKNQAAGRPDGRTIRVPRAGHQARLGGGAS